MVLYLHGKGGSAAECEHYRPLFPGREVAGLDYRAGVPWEAGEEIRSAAAALKAAHGTLTLIANSIGAYFSLCAGIDGLIDRAYFISPVVDMEGLILAMMRQAGVTEEALREKGVIQTASGEALSWEYLQYVRSHPVRWNAPTDILYGSGDALIPYETADAFARAHGARLTVMEGGEHWFHTEEQMRFLDRWIRRCEKAGTGSGPLILTERLALYPATAEQMAFAIAAEEDADLKAAYTQMREEALRHPDRWAWYAMWQIETADGIPVGDLCFKGLNDDGTAEIGYGILEPFRRQGFASEAVRGACEWALRHPGTTAVEAETEPDNAASQRVLAKCGFCPTGETGEEGPRFILRRQS